MKILYILIFFLLVSGCSSQSTSNENASDSTKIIALSADSIPLADSVTVPETQTIQPVVEVKPAAKDPSKKTLRCKFQSFEEGDCLHLIFDCADLGRAQTASLPADQLKLWGELMAFDGHGDFPVANPKYVGKTFEIVHNYLEGLSCEPGSNGESVKEQVPNLLSFKLIAN